MNNTTFMLCLQVLYATFLLFFSCLWAAFFVGV
nr:MAG TPA: hypothetical protein [Caudoviricetes sp.]